MIFHKQHGSEGSLRPLIEEGGGGKGVREAGQQWRLGCGYDSRAAAAVLSICAHCSTRHDSFAAASESGGCWQGPWHVSAGALDGL